MRRMLLGLLTALTVALGSTLVAAPAQAASKPVTIKRISTQSIDWVGTATVKPTVKKAKKVTILKRTMTVRQGKRVVTRNRSSAKLKPGTYRVTTKVTYRFKGKKRSTVARQTLKVRQGRCAALADYRSIKVSPAPRTGDAVATVARKLRHSGDLLSDIVGPMSLTQWREFAVEEGDAEGVAAFDVLIAEYGGEALMDLGVYRVCQRPRKSVDIVYIDGHVVDKAVGSL